MIIAHASIPADDPANVAKVLAEILGGEAVRFPPAGPHAWMAWAGDSSIDLEIVPRGNVITYGADEGGWTPHGGRQRPSECHLAICVDRPEAETIAIAQRAGWTARHCERGGGVFNLAEVWVENTFMIEFLDPAQTKLYKERINLEGAKRMFAGAPAPA